MGICTADDKTVAIPIGNTTTQAKFVTTVVINEIESSPPALRVHTDADASVHGTKAATNSPPNIDSGNHHRDGRLSSGTPTTLIVIASKTGNGRVRLRRIALAGNVTPINHMTTNTIALRVLLIDCSDESDSLAKYPVRKQMPIAIRNQCLAIFAGMCGNGPFCRVIAWRIPKATRIGRQGHSRRGSAKAALAGANVPNRYRRKSDLSTVSPPNIRSSRSFVSPTQERNPACMRGHSGRWLV